MLKVTYVSLFLKKTQNESCKLSFIWGNMSTVAWETVLQIALRNCCKETGPQVSIYVILAKKECMWSNTYFLQKFATSHKE